MTNDLDTFEVRLLHELRQRTAEDQSLPVLSPTASNLRRRLVAGGAIAAAAAVAGILIVPGLGTTPAYSVQEGNSGEIIVEVNRPRDAPGLEALLAEHGVSADITYLEWPMQCADDRYIKVPDDRSSGMSMSIGAELLRLTLPPGAVQNGDTVVVSLSYRPIVGTDGDFEFTGGESSVSFGVASGPVAACDPR